MRSLCAFHLIGNALILWLGYYWLGIGESDTPHLAWSAAVILLFLCFVLWLHGTALVFFQRDTANTFWSAAGSALRHIVPLFVIAIVAAFLYGLLAYWHDAFTHDAFVIGSYATMKLRKPVPPSNVLHWYHVLIWLFEWLIVPAILFPLAANVARFGWNGFRLAALRRSRNVLYWIEVCALLLLAIWVPLHLLSWIPRITPMAGQMLSFFARFVLGYLLFVVSLLALEFFTSAGKPDLTQPSTVVSP